ncbi:MAG: plastocyanin [Betaproteobacteria bacterium]|nr:plastocyanin [Betaproteobacteria bacterium]
MKRLYSFFLVVCLGLNAAAWAHGDAHKPKEISGAILAQEQAFGRQCDPKKVTRTVKVAMADSMRYLPSEIRVRRGETVRFEVRNSGKIMHELVLGTLSDLKAHADLMRKHPGMEHDEPHMAHVAPGRTERLVWQFTRAGEFHYGCLVPGHFEAGMVGKIIVK